MLNMRRALAIGLASGFLCLSHPVFAAAPSLRLITGDDYPPWTDQNLPHGGIATWLVFRAFKAAGYSVGEMLWMPWKRGFVETEQGNSDGAFPWIENPERHQKFLFSTPFLPSVEYAWTSTGRSFSPTSKDDLRQRSFCRPLGYGTFGVIEELLDEKALVRESPQTMDSCFKMLASGRTDFVYATTSDADNAMRQSGIDPGTVRRAPLALSHIDHHLIVGKANPRAAEIIAAFDKGFAKLKASGEWARMKAEFGWKE